MNHQGNGRQQSGSLRVRAVVGRAGTAGVATILALAGLSAGAWAQSDRFVPPLERGGQPGSAPIAPKPETPKPEAPKPEAPKPAAAEGAAELGVTPADPAVATATDGPVWTVSKFKIDYYRFPAQTFNESVQLPEVADLEQGEVLLGQTPTGLVRWRAGMPEMRMKLADLNDGTARALHDSAVRAVREAVVRRLNSRDVVGVVVEVLRDKERGGLERVEETGGKVVTTPATTEIPLAIIVGMVQGKDPEGREGVRTVAAGDRVGDPAINNPLHSRIAAGSPVQPGDYLRRQAIDDYARRLSRHPGRRVDVAVAPGDKPGLVSLDYLVMENKPWSVYAQISNTGTRETSKWRERFGLVHNQLTNNDDILRFDYVTTGFSSSHAFIGSYEFPLAESLRFRANASWNTFTASDVGVLGLQFRGESYSLGGELIGRCMQFGSLFIDPFVGARFDRSRVTNAGTTGDHGFFIPSAGIRAERTGDVSNFNAAAWVEWNVASVGGNNPAQLAQLGRTVPDASWTLFKTEVDYSFYLEPLLFPESFRGVGLTAPADKSEVPWQSGMTLANELGFTVRGQYAFDRRLSPTYLYTAGGFYTVRGYPEVISSGDSAITATAEHRLHVPRIFRPVLPSSPGSFRWAPSEAYGSADWDLIFRAFIDAGRVVNSQRQVFEANQTLIGAGAGVELQVLRNVTIRMDYGVALRATRPPAEPVERGDARLHFSATILF